MGAQAQAPKWQGKYPITEPEHADDLEMRAAINEHHYRLPRHAAEEKAHADYRRDQIISAAAHHRLGMNISHAAGKMDEAQKHAVMYAFAMHQLGHKDLVTPPDEVSDKMKKTPSEDLAKFKAHKADIFSMPELGDTERPAPRGKLEPDIKVEAQKIRESQMAKGEEDTNPLYQQQGYQNHPIGSTGGGLKHNQPKQDHLVEAAYHGALPIEAKFSPANKGAAKNVFTELHNATPKTHELSQAGSSSPESMVLAGALAIGHGVQWLRNVRAKMGRV